MSGRGRARRGHGPAGAVRDRGPARRYPPGGYGGDYIVATFRYAAATAGGSSRYMTGVTSRASRVEDMRPPITTQASGE